MKSITKYHNSNCIRVIDTETKVIVGKYEHIHLYVSEYDVLHYPEDSLKRYYYDENSGDRCVFELGSFESQDEAEAAFYSVMTDFANDYFDGIIEFY